MNTLSLKDRRLNTVVLLVVLALAFIAGVVLLASDDSSAGFTGGLKDVSAALLTLGSIWGFSMLGFGFWLNHPYILKDRAYTKAFGKIWDDWRRTGDDEACYQALVGLAPELRPTTPEYAFFYNFNISAAAFKAGRRDEAAFYFEVARKIEWGYHRRKHIKQLMRAAINAQAADKDFAAILKK